MIDALMIDDRKATAKLVKRASDLRVYRAAFLLSVDIHKATLLFPKIEQYALGDQMRRASKSICANLAEGFIKQPFSKAEFKRFIGMALGSGAEMQVWIEYSLKLEYVTQEQAETWTKQYDHIIRMLQTLRANS